MSEGSVFQRKSDGKWCGKYKDDTGKYRYLYRRTKGEAKQALREALKDRDEGINPTDLTVNDVLELWLEDISHTVNRRTWLNRESLYRRHIKTHAIGTKKLTKLSPDDVHGFYRDSSNVLANSTVKRLHDMLNKAAKDAVRRKQLRTNPIAEVQTPKIARKDMEVLTATQVKKLFASCQGDRLEGVYVLGACCGLRVGEALSLRWEDLDLTRGTIQVRRTLWRGNTYQPKTPHSRRTIKLPNIALDSLRRHAEKHDDPEEGWMFPNKNGTGPVDAANFWAWGWKPMLRRAGLPSTLTYHKLRHGAASLMLGQNVPIPVVSRYLGHSDPSVTLRVYSHMIDGMGGMAASGIDDALS